MATLKELFDVIHESEELSSAEELKRACKLIIRVQSMDGAERDTIRAAFKKGPLEPGDLPSKAANCKLEEDGLMCRVVVSGRDGQCACTQLGAYAFKLIEAGA